MNKTPLLVISVAGNVALLALVLFSTGKRNPAIDESEAAAAGAHAAQATGAKPAEGGIDTSNIDPALWKGMTEGDLSAQVARLREAGFPPSVVRAIVSSQLSEKYQERSKELRAAAQKATPPYWQNDQPRDAKALAAQRELSKEYSKQMKELLGTTMWIDDPMYQAQQRRQYGDLPREKIDQIERVKQDYNDLRQQVYEAAGMGLGGAMTMTAEERTKMALLEKEQRADIAALFSPKEAEDFELRAGNTANSMRYQLAAFGPNEDEFRAIHKLQSVFDEKFSDQAMFGGGVPNQELMRQRREAQKDLVAQVKATLGGERGAEYERAMDGNFQQVYRVVERLELPKQAATEVWNVQKEIEQRATALRGDRSLDNTARTEQLAALAQEANSKVTAALGQRGYEIYKQHGGYWIQNLQPGVARPGAAVPVSGGGGGGMILRP